MKFTGERYIPSKHGSIALQHYHRYLFAILQINNIETKSVLDIACGEGYGSDLLADKAKMVYGIDISEEAINHAKKEYHKSNLSFMQGDVAKIPLEDKTIDLVVSFETIEHHDKHDEMMSEIKRVLKIDGILIISSPNKSYYESNFQGKKNEYHVKELYRNEFQALLEKHFNNNYFFIQNNLFGSIITGENNPSFWFNQPIHFKLESESSDFLDARFNIAIASDSVLQFTKPASVYTYDLTTDPFALVEQKNREIQAIHQSYSWLIGSAIIKPFSFIKKLFK